MSSAIIIIVIVSIIVAAVAVGIYYAVKNKGPVGQFTEELNFYNGLVLDGRPVSIYLTALRGTANDPHNWTNWEKTPNTSPTGTSKLIPLPEGLKKAFKINYGEYGHVSIGTRGYPGINYVARPNCDDAGVNGNAPTFICERGDSYIDPYIDLLPPDSNGNQALKRGNVVQFKPDINTKMEFTFGCTEVDKSLCAVNPSCVNVPTSCTWDDNGVTKNFTDFMGLHPNSQIREDLLLHDNVTGDIIPLPAGLHLDSNTNFDISNVDGFTHEADVFVIRPTITDNSVKCYINSNVIDNPTTFDPQLLIDCSKISLQAEAACPSDEILWPGPRGIASGDLYKPVFDGQNTPASTVVKGMGYVLGAGGPFTGTFGTGSASVTDLKVYRYVGRQEEDAVAAALHYNPYLGCAGPCKILTDGGNKADTQINPITNRWARATYIKNPATNPSASLEGIRELCCTPDGLTPMGNPKVDTFNRCNTSYLWALPGDATQNYGFGFYVKDYDPRPSDIWFPGGNPYLDLANGSKYVNAINDGKISSLAPRAYAWQHDDAYKLVQCNIESTGNEVLSDDKKRQVYGQYKLMVTIGSRPAGL